MGSGCAHPPGGGLKIEGFAEQGFTLCRALHQLGLEFLREQVPDPRTLCQSLEKGELESSPFEESAMHRLRQRWCMLVGGKDWRHLASIPSGQPFLLRALAKTAELMGDADWEILTEGVVVLGFREEVPQLPQVYDHKTKWRKLDEDLPEWDRPNYSSATVNAKQLLEKFREEERLGRMASTTSGALKQDYPEDRIRGPFANQTGQLGQLTTAPMECT